MTPSKAIFFDRDGTIIAAAPPGLPSRAAHAPEHVRLLPGAKEALQMARAAGYLTVVVTNQPGPAKGQYSRHAVAMTHQTLRVMCADSGAPLDAIYTCEHHEVGGPGGDPSLIRQCDCRKPSPGLLFRAAADLAIDLSRSALIGDSERDIEAGRAAGVRCYRVGERGMALLDAVRAAIFADEKKEGSTDAALHRHE